jgi:hypothetical protein
MGVRVSATGRSGAQRRELDDDHDDPWAQPAAAASATATTSDSYSDRAARGSPRTFALSVGPRIQPVTAARLMRANDASPSTLAPWSASHGGLDVDVTVTVTMTMNGTVVALGQAQPVQRQVQALNSYDVWVEPAAVASAARGGTSD